MQATWTHIMKKMMMQVVGYQKGAPTVTVTSYDKEMEHIMIG